MALAGGVEPAERRQLTVLFCDLVGSTALSEALDPEDLCEVVRQHQRVCGRVIEAYDGHIAQYLGDGLLVYFGYPRAHDDDVRRAVLAALELVQASAQLELPALERLGMRLQLRVGIHTGLTVVGDVGGARRHERLAVGETPNLAARVQTIAAPGTIAITHATYTLASGFVECEDLGEQSLKGLSRRVRLHRVLRASGAQTRMDVAASVGLTPYVGRQRELSELLDCWKEAKRGRPRLVLVEGEPGMGKSRQIAELRACLQHEPHIALVCACAADSENSALRPLIESIEQVLGLQRDLPLDQQRQRLATAFADAERLDAEAIGLLCSLLSIDTPPALAQLTPARKRERTLELLARWIEDVARRSPILLVFEDLHWADPSTLEYIERLLEVCRDGRLMLLLTYRPEFGVPDAWRALPSSRELVLSPLSPADTVELISHVAGSTSLANEVALHVVARTDGVPLFVEELTRSIVEDSALRERGLRALSAGRTQEIPTSIAALLTARLDRMGPCKATAQVAATIGREFSRELLAAVRGLDDAALNAELRQLESANLIRGRLAGASTSYQFRHALFQDAAYQSLLRHTRREYHDMVARALLVRFPTLVEQRPELIARHFAGAAQHAQAVTHFRLASEKALARSANREAIAHARAGLAEAAFLQPQQACDLAELGLLTCLGPALIASTGFASDEVGTAYGRARNLCEHLDGRAELFPCLWGSWVFRLVRGELPLARHEAEHMLRLGTHSGDDAVLVEAHWTLGDALFWMGELEAADRQLRAAAALYRRERHHGHAFRFGQDPGVATHCYHAFVLCTRGALREALGALARAEALADELGHAFTTAWVHAFRFMVGMFMRDARTALHHAERTIEFCTQQAHPFWLAAGLVVAGWARARQGELEAGLSGMREGIDFYASTGSGVCMPLWHSLMCEVLIEAGRLSEAESALEQGFVWAQRNHEHLARVELLRLRGELQALRGDDAAATRSLRAALDLASGMDARLGALRAATVLHRHLRGTSHTVVSPLPALVLQFDAEIEVPDLRVARELLQHGPGWSQPTASGLS